jgi:hypothetical protein
MKIMGQGTKADLHVSTIAPFARDGRRLKRYYHSRTGEYVWEVRDSANTRISFFCRPSMTRRSIAAHLHEIRGPHGIVLT